MNRSRMSLPSLARNAHLQTVALLAASSMIIVSCGGYMASRRPSGHNPASPMVVTRASQGAAVDAEAPPPLSQEAQKGRFNTESYDRIYENPFLAAAKTPLSTFAIDVDTASYSNVRRFLTRGRLPPAGAVRVEELINYFTYAYPQPAGQTPFSTTAEVSACPWNSKHRLVHIGLQGRRIAKKQMPPRNLVFLLDVSGSMSSPNKLPLLKAALRLLVGQLTEQDRVAMVVYAGSSGLVLPSTPGNQREKILSALGRLQAGGSTNGGAGIQLAYKVARESFRQGGINRVILATDGDFNVGNTSQSGLVRLIEKERQSGVFLTALGFGMGNYKDSTMEKLANKGNGNYAYIDTINEARKVLVNEAGATLVTIAKDVKIQVEFNPARVSAYRLIGYENRLLRARDFNDDKKDAGEIGAGHSVTALYEVVPAGVKAPAAGKIDKLKYQKPSLSAASSSGELLTLKLRYKKPDGDTSKLLTTTVTDDRQAAASTSLRFSSAVAAFGMLLRGSRHKGDASFAMVKKLAAAAVGPDKHGYRAEFLKLVDRAAALADKKARASR